MAATAGEVPADLRCPRCGGGELVTTPQQFADGRTHLRLSCASCATFIQWQPHQPELPPEQFVLMFGRHKGQTLAEVETSYLAWLLTTVKLTARFRVAVAAVLDARGKPAAFIGWRKLNGGKWLPLCRGDDRDEVRRQLGLVPQPPSSHADVMVTPGNEHPGARRRPR